MWLKRGSVVAVFMLLLFVAWSMDVQKRISFSFDAMLPDGDSKEALLVYQKLNKIQEVFLAASAEEIDDLRQKISSLEGYKTLYPTSSQITDFTDKYRFYLYKTPDFLPSSDEVYRKLEKLKEDLLNGFKFSIEKKDPLSLFESPRFGMSMPIVKGFEDTFVFGLEIDSVDYELYYDKLNEIAKGAYIFSPFFYQVENTRIFKSQAQFILGLSALILGLLYIYWLRKPSLFFLLSTTLLSSTLFAQLIAAFVWDKVSFLSLVFSAAVSTISIDYMFHHYLHDMYGSKRGFSKPVFYGFFTTFAAFFALGCVQFALISQIALTAACALLFSYVSFAFVYPHLGLGDAKTKGVLIKGKNLLLPSAVCVVSFFVICGSFFWTTLSVDIKSLDAKNDKLRQKQDALFLGDKGKTPVLVSSDTIEELIDRTKEIKGGFSPISSLLSYKEYQNKAAALKRLNFDKLREDLNAQAKKLGFKEGYFSGAYDDELLSPPFISYSEEFLSDAFLKTVKIEDKIYAAGLYDNELLPSLKDKNIVPINSISLFQEELKKASGELTLAGTFIVFLIICVVAFTSKRDFSRALSFVLAPLAVCSLIFIFVPMTILHIFMLVVVVATSVDYGLYNVHLPGKRTNEAVFYSLLSTIAGFGVLALSSIASLQAIGITALCGAFTVWFLIYFIKIGYETNRAK